MSGVKLRIFLATVAGFSLIGWAFFMSPNSDAEQTSTNEGITSLTDRRHIPISDSNNDGVPDWQANLIDSEPIYLDATSSEPYVLPDTITAQFTSRVFEDMMTLDSFGLLAETRDEFVKGALEELDRMTKEREYTRDDLENVASVSDKEALRTYGNLVAGTIFYYQTNEENEFEIFQRMTEDESPRHLEKLAVVEKQYEDIINALLVLEVPDRYIVEHLAIVNKFSALEANVVGMQRYFDDPFYTVARYRRLTEDVLGLNKAIHNLYDALYLDEKIQFAENEALLVLVELLK